MKTNTSFMQRWFGRGWLSMGYLFLYLPIVVLVVFSFNSSRQDMVWSGFSLQWYAALMQDTEIINGLGLSLRIAVMTAFASVVLGTFAAFVLDRYRRFTGRTLSVERRVELVETCARLGLPLIEDDPYLSLIHISEPTRPY